MAASYERFLAAGEASAAAVCRSAALGRSPLKARLLVFGRGSAELAVALADWRRGIDASMPAELDEGTRSACTAFLNGQPADWLAVFGDVRAWVDLPTYPWQLRDYWLEYGVREPALEDDHPCLLLHSRGMGGEWQWLGRLPEERAATRLTGIRPVRFCWMPCCRRWQWPSRSAPSPWSSCACRCHDFRVAGRSLRG